MKKFLLVGAAVLAVIGLTGCGNQSSSKVINDPGGTGKLVSNTVVLPDGRNVVCVTDVFRHSSGGGVSCDWDNAK